MAFLWRGYSRALEASPLLTKCGTTMTLGGLGDIIEQNLSNYRNGTKNPWNPVRTAKLATFGFVMAGPLNHYWYKILDKTIPSKSMVNNVQKMIIDQVVFAPIIVTTFFASMNFMNGGSVKVTSIFANLLLTPLLQDLQTTLENKFLHTMKMNYTVWPAAQLFNFVFIPPHQRVGYVAVILLGWNAYLSYVGNH